MGKKHKKNKSKREKRKEKMILEGFKRVSDFVVSKSEPEYWESEVKECFVEKCGMVSDTEEITILIEQKAREKINTLMKVMQNTEWLAYLVGEGFLVKDIIIPKQVVSTAAVTNVVLEEDVPVIGVIHSHHSMGNSFSGTDHDFVNSNHNISLLVSNTGFSGVVRKKLPCGSFLKAKANVKLILKPCIDKKSFIEEIKEKIKKSANNVVVYSHNQCGCGFPYGQGMIGKSEVLRGPNANKNTNKTDSWKDDLNDDDEISEYIKSLEI
jgi:hypothetical protein